MTVWGSALIALVSFAVGIASLRTRRRTDQRVWVIVASVVFLLSALCGIYLVATLLLLGGVE